MNPLSDIPRELWPHVDSMLVSDYVWIQDLKFHGNHVFFRTSRPRSRSIKGGSQGTQDLGPGLIEIDPLEACTASQSPLIARLAGIGMNEIEFTQTILDDPLYWSKSTRTWGSSLPASYFEVTFRNGLKVAIGPRTSIPGQTPLEFCKNLIKTRAYRFTTRLNSTK